MRETKHLSHSRTCAREVALELEIEERASAARDEQIRDPSPALSNREDGSCDHDQDGQTCRAADDCHQNEEVCRTGRTTRHGPVVHAGIRFLEHGALCVDKLREVEKLVAHPRGHECCADQEQQDRQVNAIRRDTFGRVAVPSSNAR